MCTCGERISGVVSGEERWRSLAGDALGTCVCVQWTVRSHKQRWRCKVCCTDHVLWSWRSVGCMVWLNKLGVEVWCVSVGVVAGGPVWPRACAVVSQSVSQSVVCGEGGFSPPQAQRVSACACCGVVVIQNVSFTLLVVDSVQGSRLPVCGGSAPGVHFVLQLLVLVCERCLFVSLALSEMEIMQQLVALWRRAV